MERDPEFVAGLFRVRGPAGIGDRLRLVGTATRAEVDTHFRRSDLLVLPSRAETYGMVAAEALSHAVPVLASDVGGVPEALGLGFDGEPPGCLVPAGDPVALAAVVLGAWLLEADLRRRWRGAAMARSAALPGWPATAARVADALLGVAT